MADQQITDVIKKLYSMWAAGDPQAIPVLMEHLSDDIKWCSLANGCSGVEFTREGSCKEDVMKYFEGLDADWAMVHFTVDEFVCERDRVVMLGKCCFSNRKTGKRVETPKADTFRVSGGLIVEFNEFYDTAGMLAAVQ